MNNGAEQPGMNEVRISIDFPFSCTTNPTPTPSDIEILTRLFPSQKRVLLEMVLQGCYGNILHAIEVITRAVSTTSDTSPPAVSTQFQIPNTLPLTSSDTSALNYGANYINSTYCFVHPGYAPTSGLLSRPPGLRHFRPYVSTLPATCTPIRMKGSTSSKPAENGGIPAKEYNSIVKLLCLSWSGKGCSFFKFGKKYNTPTKI